jgi:hypothetical protein
MLRGMELRKGIVLAVVLFATIGVILFLLVDGAAADEPTRLTVLVYLDINGDKLMSEGEGIERLTVIADVDSQRQAKSLQGGQADFSLPYSKLTDIRIEVPYLALAKEVNLKDDQAEIGFRLESPELPVYLP